MNYFIVLSLLYLACLACNPNEYEVTISKTYGNYGDEEQFIIVRGDADTGVEILNYAATFADRNSVKTWNVCLEYTPHTVVMIDNYGDGWGSEMNAAPLQISTSGMLLGTYDLGYGSGKNRATASLNPSFTIKGSAAWKYSDVPQTTSNWKYTSFADSAWDESSAGSFPEFTATTRYYRMNTNFMTPDTLRNVILAFSENFGIAIYINGNEIYRKNLPSGDLTATTGAVAEKDETVVQTKYINILYCNIYNHYVFNMLTFYRWYLSSSGPTTIAIEVHEHTSETVHTDVFSLMALSFPHDNIGGTLTASPDNSLPMFAANNILSPSISSYFYIEEGPEVNLVYTLPNHGAEWVTGYTLHSASYEGYGHPTSWKFYGSNDSGSTWELMDIQEGIAFVGPSDKKSFRVSHNKKSYNMFKLHITGSTAATSVSLGYWSINTCAYDAPNGLLHYMTEMNTGYKDITQWDLAPSTSGFTNFSISPSLPTGMVLSVSSGRISGVATVAPTVYIYTVTAYPFESTQSVTCSIQLVITSCEPPNYLRINLKKTSKNFANEESYKVYDSEDTLIYTSSPFENFNIRNDALCVVAGILKIELLDQYEDGWTSGSSLTIQFPDTNNEYYDVATITASSVDSNIYIFTSSYLLPSNHPSWTYIQGSLPTNWYDPNTTPSGMIPYTYDPKPTTTSNIWMLRTIMNVNSLEQAMGFEVRILAIAGFTIYINGQELIRKNLPEGPLTTSTIPTAGETILSTHILSSPLSNIKVGSNTIAVAIINIPGNNRTTVSFSMSIQLILTVGRGTRREGLTYSAIPEGENLDSLNDDNSMNNWKVTVPTKSTVSILFDYGKLRSEYVNYHCVTNARTLWYTDPSDWMVEASNDNNHYIFIGNVTNAYFSQRSQTRCFYLPLNTKPWRYYRIILTEPAERGTTEDIYQLAELTMSFVDLSTLIPPPLAFTEQSYTGFVNSPFPEAIANSPLYTQYSITPSLPSPLEIDTSTGSIRGIPTTIMNPNQYTISAYSPQGVLSTVSITLSVVYCQQPNILFTIHIHAGNGGEEMSLELTDSNNQMIMNKLGFIKDQDHYYSFCREAGVYQIALFDNGYNGWDTGYYRILLEDNTLVYSGGLAGAESELIQKISIGYVIPPVQTEWKYLNSDITPSSDWNSNLFNDNTWTSNKPGSFGIPLGVTQYYRSSFFLENKNKYASAIITVKTKYGFIAYLNGEEVYRHNLPNTVVTKDTLAIKSFDTIQSVGSGVSITFGPIFNNKNVLCIEVHNSHIPTSTDTIDFDALLLLAPEGSNRVIDGVAYSQTPNDADIYKAFDNIIGTSYLRDVKCEEAIFRYKYNNNKKEYISSYSLANGPLCNPRTPSGWIFEGSNDGINWSVLHITHDQFYTNYRIFKDYDFYNSKLYNEYRMVVTECKNTNIEALTHEKEKNCVLTSGTKGVQISELSLYAKQITASCYPTQDGMSGAIEGQNGYKDCPQYYEGRIEALCQNGEYKNTTDYCVPMTPYLLQYPQNHYSLFVKEQINIKPIVAGVKYNCISEPLLPSGLTLEASTGIISGSTTTTFIEESYSITCSNHAGSISTTLYFASIQKEGIPIWGWILIAILALFIIALAVFCIVNRCKGKNSKSVNHKKLEKKSNMKTDTKNNNSKV
ncbi:hypothetical protein WA158_007194 [Blastocystis sp. Blastoise]